MKATSCNFFTSKTTLPTVVISKPKPFAYKLQSCRPFSKHAFINQNNNNNKTVTFTPHLQTKPLPSTYFPSTPKRTFKQLPIVEKQNEQQSSINYEYLYTHTTNNNNWLPLGLFAAFGVIFAAYYFQDDKEAEEGSGNPSSTTKPFVWKVVLTGGPCGGKSTAMSSISQRLKSLGYDVYCVPEVATLLITGGLSFVQLSREQFLAVEARLLRLQEFLEDSFVRLAEIRGRPSVIICDRGLCDNKAYITKDDFEMLLDEEGLKLVDIRDKRYDGVFHLVTAAIGAEKFYTLANNTARSESPEQARELDYAVLNAWVGHPKLKIIDNSTDFKTKINRVVEGICALVGAPSLKDYERRFLVSPITFPKDFIAETFIVETDVIMQEDGSQARLVRRSQRGSSTYVYTFQSRHDDSNNAVVERQISGREYMALKKTTLLHPPVIKRITHFVWQGYYYSYNEYLEPASCSGIHLLEVETNSKDNEITVPSFITLGKEVTDEDYSTYAFSVRGSKPSSS